MEIYFGTDCSKNTRKVEVLGMISDDFLVLLKDSTCALASTMENLWPESLGATSCASTFGVRMFWWEIKWNQMVSLAGFAAARPLWKSPSTKHLWSVLFSWWDVVRCSCLFSWSAPGPARIHGIASQLSAQVLKDFKDFSFSSHDPPRLIKCAGSNRTLESFLLDAPHGTGQGRIESPRSAQRGKSFRQVSLRTPRRGTSSWWFTFDIWVWKSGTPKWWHCQICLIHKFMINHQIWGCTTFRQTHL